MKYLIPALPLFIGFFLDLLIGDPYNFPHPIRFIGNFITVMERIIRKKNHDLIKGGIILSSVVIAVSTMISIAFVLFSYYLNHIFGLIIESILICYMLAARNLHDESMKVYNALNNDKIESARKAVSMIVGRDTSKLDRDGIIRAAVETVAENTSDGVIAPLYYIAFLGAAGGVFYKTVNTLDSMIGYRNEKYSNLGFFSAKLDDFINYIPSRISAILMITVCPFFHFDTKNAYQIWRRDRRKHASPNSAQTESVCAGALHLRLAGDAWYFGELHHKPFIGDDDRPIETEDIRRANRLMYASSILMLLISMVIRCAIYGVLFT